MGRWHLGHKVRVISVHDVEHRYAIGREGVINEFGAWGDCTIGVTLSVPTIGGGCDDWCFRPDQLEPLIPPHEACDDAEFIASLDELAQRVGEVA